MGSANYEYDTAAIRRDARRIRNCCEEIDSRALPRVKGAQSKLEGNFEGRAANALDNSLDRMRNDLRALKSELSALSSALSRYADALEEADERISRMMR